VRYQAAPRPEVSYTLRHWSPVDGDRALVRGNPGRPVKSRPVKANVEPLEANKVKLTVELEDKEVEAAIEAAFKKIAHQVNIPGFRRGKAPRRLVEAQVGADAARAQALNDSLPDYYIQAIREQEVDAIAPPQLKIVSGEEEGPVVFEAEIDTRPVPQIPGYQGLQVTIPNPNPTDDEIDAQVERLRSQYGELESVDRAAKKGDFVSLDIEGTSDGESVPGLTANDWSYEVGAELQSLGPDFDGHIDGSKAGDVKEFTSVVPPNDLDVDFKVTVKQVNERKLPELTDEWANEVSEFETVGDLRDDIATRLRDMRKSEAARALRNNAIEAIAELVDDEIPEPLIENEMQRQLREFAYRLQSQGADISQFLSMTGQSEEDFLGQLREGSLNTVRADLALRSLAEKENLEVTDEEVDAEVESLAEQFNQKVARVRRDLERADQIPAVRSDIRKSKALKWLTDNVQLVDSEGATIDRSTLGLDDHDHAEDEGEA
jgi:trigger factor